jgi:TolB protein
MKRISALLLLAVIATALTLGCASDPAGEPIRIVDPEPGEVHFGPLAMLTDGGENAEAYFSYDNKRLVFQTTRPPYACDQIMVMPVGGGNPELISTGKGRTTCAYFTENDSHIIYSTTHLAGPECPTPPDMSQGYVWGVFGTYDIVKLDLATGELVQLTDTPGYDAEPTVSPDGKTIVFTSTRDGDLDIYTMDLNGENVKRLTDAVGYDGGPFFSPDGTKIVYRCDHPEPGPATEDFQRLLADDKVRPSRMEIWVMNTDGSDQHQVTELGCASFGPFFHPSGDKIIFSSNHPNPRGREFELWMINADGSGLEQITHAEGFDGFPMWAPDGKTFVFGSNRHNSNEGDTNLFVTEWID